ncbi:MAG: lipopolysaccharide biosynthesis protein [Bacteroidales bacterium]|nr:lipopolysaccharide biosynthesis protein [Bacteroidales bacterium]
MPKSKTFAGILWAGLQRFGTMLVAFVCNIILARLLTPKDFGTVGMLLLFIVIAEVFIDSGFGAALIQRKNVGSKEYSTVFFLNLGISVILYVLLFCASPFVANFYDIPILCPMLRIEGLVLFGNALCVIQTSLMRKNMEFKVLACANLIGNIGASTIAIIAAYKGLGVWSLVIRVVGIAYLTAICLWIMSNWRPILVFEKRIVKDLFSFGGYMLLSTSLNKLSANIQTIIIGKLFSQKALGLYTQALSLRNVAADSLQNVVAQVLFPDFSNARDDKEISYKLNNSFYVITYFTTALLVFLIIVGKPLIVCLYSEKWIDAVPYFKILCIGGIFYAIQDINYYLIAAKGKSKILSSVNLIKLPFFIIALYIFGKYCGTEAILWCIVANSLITYIIYAYIATKLLDISIYTQLGNLSKSIGIACLTGFVLLSFCNLYNEVTPILNLTISSFSYLTIFSLFSVIFKVYPFKYLLKILSKK